MWRDDTIGQEKERDNIINAATDISQLVVTFLQEENLQEESMNIAWERISLLMSCNMFLIETMAMAELFFNIIIYQLCGFFLSAY